MTWVRLSDDWFEDDRIEELGGDAVAVHLSALAYISRRLTDGRLPCRATRHLYPVLDLDAAIKVLVASGLWEETDTGYYLVAWVDHVLPADEVAKVREQNAIRQERFRRHQRNDHSMCERCWYVRAHGDSVGNAVTNTVSNTPSTRLASTRPVAIAEGRVEGADGDTSATAPVPRPLRTTEGWLATIDADALAALPWEVGEDCPHRDGGWAWKANDSLACRACDAVARGDRRSGEDMRWAVESLARRHSPGWGPPTYPAEVWQAVHTEDPQGVTLALDLASLLVARAGPVDPAADEVNGLAGLIYERNIDHDRLTDAWAALEHQEETR